MRHRAARWPGRILVLLFAGAAGCGGDTLSGPAPSGTLEIKTTTAGSEIDPDGYTVQVDGHDAGAIGTAATIRSDLAVGNHTVQLAGLAANCTVTGENPRTVSVTASQIVTATFEVTCGPTSGSLQVSASTSGPSPDADGYLITVDGTDRGTIGASAAVSLDGVTAGQHEIGLSGVAANCTVSGPNPQTVTITPGASASVTFAVTCTGASANAGSIRITTATSGADPGAKGYQVALDGGATQPIGVNASATIANVAAGSHSVRLSGLSGSCTVQGANPRQVSVTAGASVTVTFTVSCSPASGPLWKPMTSGTSTFLENVSGSSPTNVFAAGQNLGCTTSNCGEMTILRYNGTGWATQYTHGGGVRGLWAAPAGQAFALAEGGGFPGPLLYYDGQQWSPMAAQPPTPNPQEETTLNAIWGSSASDIFAAGMGSSGIGVNYAYIVHYDGTAWSRMNVPDKSYLDVTGLWGSSATDVYAVAQYSPYDSPPTDDRAVILHYDGRTWSEVLREPDLDLRHIWGSSATDVYATGSTSGPGGATLGAIWHYDGHGWSALSIPQTPALYSVWGSSSRDIYALALGNGPFNTSGNIWHFDGATWKEIKTQARGLQDIWGSSATDIFAVGADGTILHGP